jgi:copper(I)-binding protein
MIAGRAGRAMLAVALVVAGAACSSSPGPSTISVENVRIGAASAGRAAGVYGVIRQRGGPDRLVGVEAAAGPLSVMAAGVPMDGAHGAHSDVGLPLAVRPGSSVVFAPNGMHLMLPASDRARSVGEVVSLTFRFDRHAPVTVDARVVGLTELYDTAGT